MVQIVDFNGGRCTPVERNNPGMMKHEGWAILEVVHALGLKRGMGGALCPCSLVGQGTPRVHSAGALGRTGPH